jgi:23S rRNA pseudouridine1911/1915/1917 synthase
LQFHLERLSAAAGPTRPGIVHRLDRDTSGVMVIAKTEHAHWNLAAQFQNRLVSKEYLAIVAGGPPHDRDRIDRPIGPHPHQREKMAVRRDHRASRPAQTDYETLRRFDGFSSVRAVPQTGRTHQIRVHLASIGCPVLCDRMYGGRSRLTLGEIRRVPDDETVVLARQALHASKLKLAHPATGKPLEFKAPFPDDLGRVLAEMEKYRA